MALPTKACAAPCERAICTATVWLPAVTGTTAWTVRVWPSWQVTVAESSRSSSVTAPACTPSTVIRLRRRASPAGPPALARSAVVLPRTSRTPALGAVTALLTAVVNVALAKASKMAAMGSSSSSTHGSSRLPAVAVVARARSLAAKPLSRLALAAVVAVVAVVRRVPAVVALSAVVAWATDRVGAAFLISFLATFLAILLTCCFVNAAAAASLPLRPASD